MAQSISQKAVNNFVKGLITEASELTFPEGASVDESNCDLRRDGTRRRRLNVEYESSHVLSSFTLSNSEVVATGEWTNAGGDANRDLLVLQKGSALYFYNKANTPYSNQLVTSLSLSSFSAGTGALTTLMQDLGASASLAVSGKFEDADGELNEAASNLKQALRDSGLSFGSARELITKSLAGRALSIFGGNVSIQNLVARSQGQIFNPNMELLFNSPSLRNFNFSFKMTPRSADEGEEIKTIIKFFKRGMAPKAGEKGLFLNTPNVFELRYRQGNGEHQFLHRFKQCFMTDISVNYTGEGVYATYNNGTPVSMIMNLSFKEVAPIYDIDYDSVSTGPLADPDRAFREGNTGFGGVGY